jgi:hypothetical protein
MVFEKERIGESKGVVALSYPFILNQNLFYALNLNYEATNYMLYCLMFSQLT